MREQHQRGQAERQAHIDALTELERRLRRRPYDTLLIRARAYVRLTVDTGPGQPGLSEQVVVVCVRVGETLTFKSISGLDFGPVNDPETAAELVAQRVEFRAGEM